VIVDEIVAKSVVIVVSSITHITPAPLFAFERPRRRSTFSTIRTSSLSLSSLSRLATMTPASRAEDQHVRRVQSLRFAVDQAFVLAFLSPDVQDSACGVGLGLERPRIRLRYWTGLSGITSIAVRRARKAHTSCRWRTPRDTGQRPALRFIPTDHIHEAGLITVHAALALFHVDSDGMHPRSPQEAGLPRHKPLEAFSLHFSPAFAAASIRDAARCSRRAPCIHASLCRLATKPGERAGRIRSSAPFRASAPNDA